MSSSNSTWLLLSESYNPLWKAYIGGTELESVPMDSVVNAFLVPAGENQTVVIKFGGQSIYQNIVLELVVATGVATAFTVALAVLINRRNARIGRDGSA
jgi:hypothetical protein